MFKSKSLVDKIKSCSRVRPAPLTKPYFYLFSPQLYQSNLFTRRCVDMFARGAAAGWTELRRGPPGVAASRHRHCKSSSAVCSAGPLQPAMVAISGLLLSKQSVQCPKSLFRFLLRQCRMLPSGPRQHYQHFVRQVIIFSIQCLPF